MPKMLPEHISKEAWVNPAYMIARFMKSRKAYSTKQNPKCLFTMKRIFEDEIGEQVHTHIRFYCCNNDTNEDDTLDIDLYIPIEEWINATNLIREDK